MSVPLCFAAALVAGTASALMPKTMANTQTPQHTSATGSSVLRTSGRMPCCEEADCARTEARIRGGGWEAKAPDGTWVVVPPESVVSSRGLIRPVNLSCVPI